MMKIELLTVAGCPNVQPTLSLLEAILADLRVRACIEHVVVPDEKTARDLHFPGSPTVRVNGYDVDAGNAVDSYGLACRVYDDGGQPSGVPPAKLIRDALEAADA